MFVNCCNIVVPYIAVITYSNYTQKEKENREETQKRLVTNTNSIITYCIRLIATCLSNQFTGLTLNSFLEEAVFFQHHLNRQESHPISHGKHHSLGLFLELFQID
ncbi:hypothetical protein G4B88_019193 [Cannabis sativa]|uniref:Uncharacterized protein n=1 Tax=Cannabis sativa TaxID=3483 RepID=A0A7J6HME3_CANSA|nr:hypothetical protein G4B88_019193 [Cannabis sativa]